MAITTVNTLHPVTYDALANGGRALLWTGKAWNLTDGAAAYRWVGRCKGCRAGHKLEGRIVQARRGAHTDTLIDSSGVYYFATSESCVKVACSCGGWVPLQRVTEGANRSKHECNAKCLAATGPSCDCKCKGLNHGSNH